MREPIWRIAAFIASRRPVADWLIRRAQRTPYTPILSKDGMDCYMGRWWLFNAYGKDAHGTQTPARRPWMPSVRVHHIMREDRDRHLHDHPWNARTIVLRGWYMEERPWDALTDAEAMRAEDWGINVSGQGVGVFCRARSYTGRLLFGQYHRISAVPETGVWTLFWTWKKRGTWGFDVDGAKVPWREYLAFDAPNNASTAIEVESV